MVTGLSEALNVGDDVAKHIAHRRSKQDQQYNDCQSDEQNEQSVLDQTLTAH
jgi:hypothetical protein